MLARLVYNAGLPLALAGAHVSALFLPKMREALAGRRGFGERWRGYARRRRARPVWFHVASVGEFEQARPLITALASRYPTIPVVLTFSSPSGYHFALRREKVGEGSNIEFMDYLPADTVGNVRLCLDAVQPRTLVLVKFDLWPNLIWEARRRRISIVLIAATLSPSSRRLLGVARLFYRSVYRAIDRILAIAEGDAERFRASVPGHAGIGVAGDTRFDRVVERWQQRSATRFGFEGEGGPVLIAGSTWPRDEAHLLGALRRLLDARQELRVIIAPHEPHPDRIAALEAWASGCEGSVATATAASGGERIVLIDTVGVLAEAYRLADVAFVGGAFSTGVHSVIEPAIAGLPVTFGPLYRNSLEAVELIECGAGFCVRDEEEMVARLGALLDDQAARTRAGEAARAYVVSKLGATEKCMEVLEEFL